MKGKATSYPQGTYHKAITDFSRTEKSGQKGMASYIQSDKRKKPSTKNTLPRKAILQIGKKDEELSRQAKVKRVQHH